MDPPTQAPLCLSFPVPMAPTLNPNPEALLNFACRALSQAGVQPRIVRLEIEQGDQLLLAPSVRSLPTLQSTYPLLEFSLHLAFEVQLLGNPSCPRDLVSLSSLALACLGVHRT